MACRGTITIPFSDLTYALWDDQPGATFDPSRVVKLDFEPFVVGDFEFCISNLELLDADGDPIMP